MPRWQRLVLTGLWVVFTALGVFMFLDDRLLGLA